jgi:hypothetical protein
LETEEINMNGEKLTLLEAFSMLIKQRLWYKYCHISPRQAKKDKYMFGKGKNIPEERMRAYLSSSGAICVQEEKWVLNNKQNEEK